MNAPNHIFPTDTDLHRFLLVQAMEVSHDVVTLIDMDGRVTYANPTAGEFLKCRPYEMTGQFLWDLIDDPAQAAHIMTTTLEHGQWRGEVVFCRGEEHIPLRWRTALVQSRSGEVVGIVTTGGNFTSQKALETRLSRIEHQRLLGEMAAGVAHNVSHIFTAILGQTHLLQNDELSSSVRDDIRIIMEAAQKGAELVRRIQMGGNGTPSEVLEAVDLNAVVKTSLEIAAPKWKDESKSQKREIAITLDLHATRQINGQASQLDEVVVNLIFNAVDAMPEGGALSIRTWDEKNTVCLSVTDTGIGMDAQTQRRIGELFFTTKENGHGIGLATCYRIVKALSGKIEIESAPTRGTTFVLRFPLRQTHPVEQVSETDASALSGQRILVVEDEKLIRNLLVKALPNCRVDVAADGETGLAFFQSQSYDAVLIDLSLPGIDGVDTAQQMRAISDHTPLVLMTGWARAQEGNEAHFQAFLTKPFTIQDLHRLLTDLFQS